MNMELRKTTSEGDTYLQPISVFTASAKNFKGIPEPCDFIISRPLMISACTQTIDNDFGLVKVIEIRDIHTQREKELQEKIRVLEENLKAHTELLSQIHETSAKTSTLLAQQQSQIQQNVDNSVFNIINSANVSNINRPMQQLSPKVVNAINCNQQVNYSGPESVKYTIIADGRGNHNEEPIEIQLAEEDGALNLNSSADSQRLEICLASEENLGIKSECNTDNSTITLQNQVVAPTTDQTPIENHCIKKRKLSPEETQFQYTAPNIENVQTTAPFNNMQPTVPTQNQKRRSSGNSLLKTPKTKNNKNNNRRNIVQNATNNSSLPYTNNISLPKKGAKNDYRVAIDMNNVMVSLGPNNTRIPAKVYDNMNWTSPSIATRKLLMATFDRETLATHSMTGKPSPAFKDHDKPVKEMLDVNIVRDIIFTVTNKCNVSDKEVRNAITTKCADENKMMKLQMNKRAMRESNKENIA